MNKKTKLIKMKKKTEPVRRGGSQRWRSAGAGNGDGAGARGAARGGGRRRRGSLAATTAGAGSGRTARARGGRRRRRARATATATARVAGGGGAAWRRRCARRRRGATGGDELCKTAKCYLYTRSIGPSWWHQPGLMPPFVPVGATNRDQRPLFSSPKGGKRRPLVPVWWHQPVLKGWHWYWLVLQTGTNAPL